MPRSKWLSDLWSETADFFESFVRESEEQRRLPTQDELLQHQTYVQGFIDILSDAQELAGEEAFSSLPSISRQRVSNVSLNSTSRTSSERSFASSAPPVQPLSSQWSARRGAKRSFTETSASPPTLTKKKSAKREFTAEEDAYMWKTFQADLQKHPYIRPDRITPKGTCKRIAAKLGVAVPTIIGMRLRVLAELYGHELPGRERGKDNYWSDEDIKPAPTRRGGQRAAMSAPPTPPLPPPPPLPPTTKDAFKFTRAEDAAVLGAHLSSNNPEARNLAVDNIARGLNRTQAAVRTRIQKLLQRDARGGGRISSSSSDASADSGDEDESSAYEQLPPSTRRTASRSTPLSTDQLDLVTSLRGPPKQRSAPSAGPLKKGPYTEEEDTVIWSAYLGGTTEEERSAALQQAAKQLRRTPSGLQVHMRALLAEQEEGQFDSADDSLDTLQPTPATADTTIHDLTSQTDVSSAGTVPVVPTTAPASHSALTPPSVPDLPVVTTRDEKVKQSGRSLHAPDTGTGTETETESTTKTADNSTHESACHTTVSSTSTSHTPAHHLLPPPLPLPPQAAVTAVWAQSQKKFTRWVEPQQVADYLHIRRPMEAHDQTLCVVYGCLIYVRQQGRFPSYHRLIDTFVRVCAHLSRQYRHLSDVTRDSVLQLVDLLLETGALFQDDTRGSTVRIDRDIGDFRDLRRAHDRYLIGKIGNLTAASHTEVVNALCWPVDATVRDLCDEMQGVIDEVHHSVRKLALYEKDFSFLK